MIGHIGFSINNHTDCNLIRREEKKYLLLILVI
jgi:hypothetical protein